MELITLNTWGGRAGATKLLNFFAENRKVDFFCLQEVWAGPYVELNGRLAGNAVLDYTTVLTDGRQQITSLLESTHTSYFRPHLLDDYGLMTAIANKYQVIDEGDVFVYGERGRVPDGDLGHHSRNVQWVTVTTDRGPRTVLNFHGLWNGKGKTDSEDRVQQSRNIVQCLQTFKHPFVLAGDFNLLPGTESLKMLESFGLRNLITEYGVTSTRTSLYEKDNKFADYVFVSSEIEVQKFEVLPDEVSDHSALYLEFC